LWPAGGHSFGCAMFEFEELDAALPIEAYVVSGAGLAEVDGLYQDTQVACHGASIFRHQILSNQLLSREKAGERFGWLIGASGRPLYGVRTETLECPKTKWRAFKGEQPAPLVEGFSSVADASARLCEVWCQEADRLVNTGKFRSAAEVYKRAVGLELLADFKKAEMHALRAKTFRQLAESKKKVRMVGENNPSAAEDVEEDPLHGLAAEWAIEEAEGALALDSKCFLAAWEGAIAAKHIGWWNKGRILAKKAMQAVPGGPEHRSQRETASTLFLLMAEEEQAEKQKKVVEMQMTKKVEKAPDVDPKELEWAIQVVGQLNDSLKVEDFKRPHHQLWKIIGPGLLKKDSDDIFDQIRQLVWDKWNPIAWQLGYRTQFDKTARKKLCSRIVNVANDGGAEEVMDKIKEIEDRCCLEWTEIPEQEDRPTYDETWAYHKREDGTWGTWSGGTNR